MTGETKQLNGYAKPLNYEYDARTSMLRIELGSKKLFLSLDMAMELHAVLGHVLQDLQLVQEEQARKKRETNV